VTALMALFQCRDPEHGSCLESPTSAGCTWKNWSASGDKCEFAGVMCKGGRVENLNLRYSQLWCAIPDSISQLSSLARLDLSYNSLFGQVPKLPANLSHVSLGHNINISGTFPTISANEALLSVDFALNRISGTLPDSLGNMQQMLGLLLTNNSLTGSIPASMGNMHSLFWLDLQNNQLSGSVPTTFNKLPTHKGGLYLGEGNVYRCSLPATLPGWRDVKATKCVSQGD
jgi:Leucine-rich repeat (LRR) protein